jgi:hypothetical protein
MVLKYVPLKIIDILCMFTNDNNNNNINYYYNFHSLKGDQEPDSKRLKSHYICIHRYVANVYRVSQKYRLSLKVRHLEVLWSTEK